MPTDTAFDNHPPLCRTCKHGVFDEVFGEYKCKAREITMYDAYYRTECELYKKKKGDANNENIR